MSQAMLELDNSLEKLFGETPERIEMAYLKEHRYGSSTTHLTIRPLRHFKNFVCSLDVRLRSFCFEATSGLRPIHKGNFHIHTCKQKFFNVYLVVQRASKKMLLPTRFCQRELLAEWTSYWEKFLPKRTCWENFPRTLSDENCSSWQIRQ